MYNANVGVLGHVDSGKTSLAKALSTQASTAAFDRNPQSQERGITLDLGFSACHVPSAELPSNFEASKYYPDGLQLTFVDCPGHASLIRTIMGGAQIIDVMMLVIDVTKGIQTQTAECIVVGEMLSRRLVVALNKVDMVPGATAEERQKTLEKMKKKLRTVFTTQTRWPTAQFVEVAAAPSGGGEPQGMSQLTQAVVKLLDPVAIRTARSEAQPAKFLLSVDHCFSIKGQGTILTGTVLDGKVSVGDEVDLPDYGLKRRVKSMQMFKKPVQVAYKGDRIGMCVPQFDSKEMERGLCCAPGAGVVSITSAILAVKKVRFHKLDVEQGSKYHITVGHTTVMGTMRFFSCATAALAERLGANADPLFFDPKMEYDYLENLPEESCANYVPPAEGAVEGEPAVAVDGSTSCFAVVLLEQPVTCQVGVTVIASKLDTDIHVHQCRLAVQGRLLTSLGAIASALQGPDKAAGGAATDPNSAPNTADLWRGLNVIRRKTKTLPIDRIIDANNCIAKSIVKEGPEATKFVGLKVHLVPPAAGETATAAIAGEAGVIEGTFGKSGKLKIRFQNPVFATVLPAEGGKKKSKSKEEDADGDGGGNALADKVGTITLHLKKYPYALHSRLAQ